MPKFYFRYVDSLSTFLHEEAAERGGILIDPDIKFWMNLKINP